MSIAENFQTVQNKIRRACLAAGREEGAVQLVAVSKTQAEDRITAALATGHRVFGENRVQEAYDHWAHCRVRYPDLRLHLIGPLQTNKVKEAVALFDCIETLDREKLAQTLSVEMKKQGRDLPCFIQVNTGEEEQKAGIVPSALPEFLSFCQKDCGLNIAGLMCIPPVNEPSALHFALLKKLAQGNNLSNLSMGMSGDFEKGIALGASHIRVGTALFGDRT